MVDNLEKRVSDAKKHEDEIAARLSKARADHAAAVEAHRITVDDGNLEDIFKMLTTVERCERAVRVLEDALAVASTRSREAEHLLNQERDRIERETEVEKTRGTIATIEAAFADCHAAAEPLIAALQQAGTIEGNNLANFALFC
jgi:predicted  nucleic acid-binding Zn-ribbon protein